MSRFYLIFLTLFILSCQKEKKLKDYNRNDFVEVQGIVFESKEEKHFLSESTWAVAYIYKLNGEQYNGEGKKFTEPMSMGQTLIILVNKINPKVNFFKEIGVLTE